uniref:DUF2428 domain-containing protein n=1 Tax=Macrostomum lignano TaxID=282301 RepID=A0A1I8FH61_9PLAT
CGQFTPSTKELLFDSRHRGAFELAYEGFGRFLRLRLALPGRASRLPAAGWLAELLSDLAGPPVDRLRLCLTGARLAFLINILKTRSGEDDEFVVHVYNTHLRLCLPTRASVRPPPASGWRRRSAAPSTEFGARNWSVSGWSCLFCVSLIFCGGGLLLRIEGPGVLSNFLHFFN